MRATVIDGFCHLHGLVTYYSFIIILEIVKNSDLIYLEPRANLNLGYSNKIMR